jgi:hypothetical protein
MQAAISQADATVIAAIAGAAGVIYAAYRANRTNRAEHAVNGDKLDRLLENQEGIRREVHFIRTDVTDIHGAITELRRADHDTDARVTRLERHQPEGNDAA